MPTKYADSKWVTELSVWDLRFSGFGRTRKNS